jgi:hypothetical protein
MEPPAWTMDVPFNVVNETDTGQVNIEGSKIYSYKFDLPGPFLQMQGMFYWFDITAYSNDPLDPPLWRWQEADRSPMFLGHAPAAEQTESTAWHSIEWGPPPFIYSSLAFEITSQDPQPREPNKVVADDFISDGRPIKAVGWWGSYLDAQYSPTTPMNEPYVMDGWFLSFHWAKPAGTANNCPPDVLFDPPPTVTGVYYAPVDAVSIVSMGYMDCHGHEVFAYAIDLAHCCLLCSEPDPRDGQLPARPEMFKEVSGFRYWLDVQAVVGVTWMPPACAYEDRILTDHLPSPITPEGHFWGWHTSPAATMPQSPLSEACTGKILDFTPYPPNCWDYGQWTTVPWDCPAPAPPPVHMAFELLAPVCHPPGDVNMDGLANGDDIQCFIDCLLSGVVPGCACGCADMNGDFVVDMADVPLFVAALLGP